MQDLHSIPVRIANVLPQDRAGYAIDFLFSFYICLPIERDIHRNVLDCLFPIWTKKSSISPLRPAVTAVASILLDAWSQIKPDQPGSLSRSQYAQAVAALRKSLQQTGNVSDETIMATLMMDMYDNILAFLTGQRNMAPHMNGTVGLIERRRSQPCTDEITQKLILGTRSQIAGRAMSNAQGVPSIVSTWCQGNTNVPTTPGFRLDELNIELANLQLSAAQVIQDNGKLASHALERANKLDHQYADWMKTLPEDWLPTRVFGSENIPQNLREAGCYQDFCDIYKSIFVANVFTSYYSARLKTQLLIVGLLDYLPADPTRKARELALLTLQDMADNICASVPFHLGDRTTGGRVDDKAVRFPGAEKHGFPEGHYAISGAFGGFFLIAPLSELLSPRIILRSGQQQWIIGQIGRIRRICNIDVS